VRPSTLGDEPFRVERLVATDGDAVLARQVVEHVACRFALRRSRRWCDASKPWQFSMSACCEYESLAVVLFDLRASFDSGSSSIRAWRSSASRRGSTPAPMRRRAPDEVGLKRTAGAHAAASRR
jgi:hypothetical protein